MHRFTKISQNGTPSLDANLLTLTAQEFPLTAHLFQHYLSVPMAKKNDRIVVTLECSEAAKEGKSPSRYVTRKNKRTTTEKLELRKYNKYLRRVTLHKEVKS